MSDRPLRRGNWSVQELERLRLLFPHRGVDQTAVLLRRSPESVQRKALSLLRGAPRQGAWTSEEDLKLRRSWGALEPRLLGMMLGRSGGEVRRRAEELRRDLRSGPWTREEQRILKKLYGTRRDEDLEVSLLRSPVEIGLVAEKLCLAKDKRFQATINGGMSAGASEQPRSSSMPRWSPSDVRVLRELYPHRDNLTVARELGRSVASVANKACQLGIKKSPQLLADIGRANISQRYASDHASGAPAAATTVGAAGASQGRSTGAY